MRVSKINRDTIPAPPPQSPHSRGGGRRQQNELERKSRDHTRSAGGSRKSVDSRGGEAIILPWKRSSRLKGKGVDGISVRGEEEEKSPRWRG